MRKTISRSVIVMLFCCVFIYIIMKYGISSRMHDETYYGLTESGVQAYLELDDNIQNLWYDSSSTILAKTANGNLYTINTNNKRLKSVFKKNNQRLALMETGISWGSGAYTIKEKSHKGRSFIYHVYDGENKYDITLATNVAYVDYIKSIRMICFRNESLFEQAGPDLFTDTNGKEIKSLNNFVNDQISSCIVNNNLAIIACWSLINRQNSIRSICLDEKYKVRWELLLEPGWMIDDIKSNYKDTILFFIIVFEW